MDTDDEAGRAGDGARTPDIAVRAAEELAAAATAFETVRRELNALLSEVSSGETEHGKRLAPLSLELARAVGVLARERERIDAARRAIVGERSADEFDFDAARDEVRRALARLRDAGL